MGLARNHIPPDALLERAGIMCLENKLYEAVIVIFSNLLLRHQNYTMAWYAVGHGFMVLSHTSGNNKHVQLAVSCLKRSLLEDSNNKLSRELLEAMQLRPSLSPTDYESYQPFRGEAAELLNAIRPSQIVLVEAVRSMPSWNDRMGLVMMLGEQPDATFLPILIDAVDNDPHKDVKMAAVKRLALHPTSVGVKKCFERLINSGRWKELQPYPSMALSELSRVGQSWANELLRNLKTN